MAHRFEQLVWGWTARVREGFWLQTKVLPMPVILWFLDWRGSEKLSTGYSQLIHSESKAVDNFVDN
jgi:hypothetical protein